MFRFITPIILIGISIVAFFTFISPSYDTITEKRAEQASYNEALTNSKALEEERDKLTQKYNSISAENLERLRKFLPENVDNIRLILEIEKIAAPYGMVLRDVRYNTTEQNSAVPAQGEIQGGYAPSASQDYGVWDLEFSTTGTYKNFSDFIKDLERNLRIVDISRIEFSSDTGAGVSTNSASSAAYQYRFTIKTYWLRN